MTRCHCSPGSGPWARRDDHHNCPNCRDREGRRWAWPALGVILALAAVGLVREHSHGAVQAARAIGYGLFALSVTAGVILTALRARRRARDRQLQPPARPAITRAGRAGLPPGRRAIPGSGPPPLPRQLTDGRRPGAGWTWTASDDDDRAGGREAP